MNALILVNPYLSEENELYQPRRIAEELFSLGVSVHILPCAWTASVGREGIEEKFSEEYDFCVFLDKDKYTPRALEARGMRLFNRASAIELCDDKMLAHLALAGKVPMPRTYFAPLCYKPQKRAKSAKEIGGALGYPVVVKECFGSLGAQVYLARDESELSNLSKKLKLRPHIYQEFIGESAGRDVRAVCVGGEVVACMERRSERDFRSNLALGGHALPFTPTDEIRALCKKVTNELSLDYCGVDFLFSKEGMLVCEVNSNAFFGGIEKITGVNIAAIYAEYMLKSIHGVRK